MNLPAAKLEQKVKHTLGPWEVSSPDGELGIYAVATDIKVAIACKYELQPEERYANARLIAAAPEMLEALEAAWDSLQPHPNGRLASDSEKSWKRALTLVPAVLLKAKGEL